MCASSWVCLLGVFMACHADVRVCGGVIVRRCWGVCLSGHHGSACWGVCVHVHCCGYAAQECVLLLLGYACWGVLKVLV